MARASLSVAGLVNGEYGLAATGFTLAVTDGSVYRGGSFIGETSPDVATFNALIWGLENARAAGVDDLSILINRESVVEQVTGKHRVHVEGLKPLYAQSLMLLSTFTATAVEYYPTSTADAAVRLANDALDSRATIGDFLRRPTLKQSLFDLSSAPSVTNPEPVLPIPQDTVPSHEVEVPVVDLETREMPDDIGTNVSLDPELHEDETFALEHPEHDSSLDDESSYPDSFSADEPLQCGPSPEDEPSGIEPPYEDDGYGVPSVDYDSNIYADILDHDDEDYTSGLSGEVPSPSHAPVGQDDGYEVAGEPDGGETPASSGEPAVVGNSFKLSKPSTVLVGVTGCIAAYKACEIVRELQKAGCRVKVVMTQAATRFVGPATFKALTHEEVSVSLFDAPDDPIHHISLAKEADLVLIAPCTANVAAKIAHGVADDLLTTTVLATTAPVAVAPAMNVNMWQASVTQENIDVLRGRGMDVIEPSKGVLACGDEGVGKLADVKTISNRVLSTLEWRDSMEGLSVLVTAGPTYEPIDPVRFIGNRSSGRTGYAIAEEFARRGASVTLVSGPCSLQAPLGVSVKHVQTAQQMLDECRAPFYEADVAIFSAAVADYAPLQFSTQKLKKSDGGLSSLRLQQTPDIMATLTEDGSHGAFVVGFAAETSQAIAYAQGKLASKHADLIVANDVSGILGFGTPDNKVWFVSSDCVRELPVMSKERIAAELANTVMDRLTR